MPYRTRTDLPTDIQNNLPEHAQDIFRAAYNSAWEEYKDHADRKNDNSLEGTANAVAWSAVKKEYHKRKDGRWVRN